MNRLEGLAASSLAAARAGWEEQPPKVFGCSLTQQQVLAPTSFALRMIYLVLRFCILSNYSLQHSIFHLQYSYGSHS